MNTYIQIFLLAAMGMVLLWFGYILFFGLGRGKSPRFFGGHGGPIGKRGARLGQGRPGEPGASTIARWNRGSPLEESFAGASQTCPVCSARLREGELVSSAAFPSFNGGKDRMMHIKGCVYCLSGERERICPVCKKKLNLDQILVCRMFERAFKLSHIHILGCTRCRKAVL